MEEIVHGLVKMVQRFEKMVQGFEEMVQGFEEMVQGFEKMVQGLQEMVQGFEEMVRRFEKMVGGFEKMVWGFDEEAPVLNERQQESLKSELRKVCPQSENLLYYFYQLPLTITITPDPVWQPATSYRGSIGVRKPLLH
jgi:hypothetical protein